VRPCGYTGTPSFLKIILEKARELGADVSSLKRAAVSGEAFPAPIRDELKARGIDAYQAYGTADLGMVAYESEAREGLILGEDLILEIVRPGTGDIAPPGEVGEVVVTVLTPEYPLIRFGTGDLSMLLEGHSPCGRTNYRIKGWMGRADQRTKVKGMFVDPSQIAEVVRRHKEIIRARLVVSRDAAALDRMVLKVEMGAPAENPERIAASLQDVTKLRGEVEIVPERSLPNDGKIIDDTRPVD
jgi:phenylacetate-CoA ligase